MVDESGFERFLAFYSTAAGRATKVPLFQTHFSHVNSRICTFEVIMKPIFTKFSCLQYFDVHTSWFVFITYDK